ncbi:MAG: polysaccharide deacetylase family protein, partial [Ginsengibacter sp.]
MCSANTTEKIIAISFDDGPVENYTPQILSLLKQENIKAAFFCI